MQTLLVIVEVDIIRLFATVQKAPSDSHHAPILTLSPPNRIKFKFRVGKVTRCSHFHFFNRCVGIIILVGLFVSFSKLLIENLGQSLKLTQGHTPIFRYSRPIMLIVPQMDSHHKVILGQTPPLLC